mmetsp:Transcript_597/g.652  ORF Transcript_597/g.652 Transcript_597/m.652 type:complete len:93 (+) Transcript_597:195-473(+)
MLYFVPIISTYNRNIMSGKAGQSNSGSSKSSSSQSRGNNGSNTSTGYAASSEPAVVSGHEYHRYSNEGRYAYIGKDDSGTPEFLDYGRKGGR